jgi:ankyrin repeat protein
MPTAKDLAVAARNGDVDTMHRLLGVGVPVNEVVEFGGTALSQAAAANQVGSAAFLLDNGADINAVTAGGAPVIELAAEKGYEAVTQLLVDRGADLTRRDRVRVSASSPLRCG